MMFCFYIIYVVPQWQRKTVWPAKSKILTIRSFIGKKLSITGLVERPRLRTKMKGFYQQIGQLGKQKK